MSDIKVQAEKINIIARNLKDRAEFFSTIKIDAAPVSESVKDVLKSSSPGKKLFKVGLALTLLPEPITVIPGVPMMLTGYALTKMRSSIGVKDVETAFNEDLETLKNLTLEL